tara:strand:+ start:1612 stop:1857 length:246 start_codon:yes stop_codon:yes gene_type:complete
MISCDQHDYIEIACMYRYPIRISLKSNSTLDCTAIDTHQNEHRNECIKVEFNGIEKLIVLNDIDKIEVLIDNPHFNYVSFD